MNVKRTQMNIQLAIKTTTSTQVSEHVKWDMLKIKANKNKNMKIIRFLYEVIVGIFILEGDFEAAKHKTVCRRH